MNEQSSPTRSSLKSRASAERGGRSSVKFNESNPSRDESEPRPAPAAAESSSRGRSVSPEAKSTKPASKAAAPAGRSPSPTKQLFSEEDFERKRDAPDADKRKKMAAKARGLAIEPKDWSRAELIDRLNRFCKFSQDKISGSAELKMKDGFSLSTEEVKVICELCRRVNEIQMIDMSSCGATDDHMQVIINEGFKNLRHLKELYLSQNQLSASTITSICGHFPKLYRKLEVLDLRENSSMTFDDGSRLFHALPGITLLNGLNVALMHSDEDSRVSYDFSDKDIRIMELGIICGLIGQMARIQTINLRSNRITAKGMHYLLDTVKKYPRIKCIDLSHNPITNDSTDFSAVERLLHFVQKRTHLTTVLLDGIVFDETLRERIELSLMVNRSVEGTADGYHFSKYMDKLIRAKAKPKVKSAIADWEPRLDEVDEAFIRSNRLPICTIATTDVGFNLAWREQPKEVQTL